MQTLSVPHANQSNKPIHSLQDFQFQLRTCEHMRCNLYETLSSCCKKKVSETELNMWHNVRDMLLIFTFYIPMAKLGTVKKLFLGGIQDVAIYLCVIEVSYVSKFWWCVLLNMTESSFYHLHSCYPCYALLLLLLLVTFILIIVVVIIIISRTECSFCHLHFLLSLSCSTPSHSCHYYSLCCCCCCCNHYFLLLFSYLCEKITVYSSQTHF